MRIHLQIHIIQKALLPEVLVDLCSSLYYEAIMMIQPIFQKNQKWLCMLLTNIIF